MFLDSSAILALLYAAPEASDILLRIAGARRKPLISPLVRSRVVTTLATGRAVDCGRGVELDDIDDATDLLDELLSAIGCHEPMITTKTARNALAAFATYGEDAGHPAALTLEDCYAYAAAKQDGLPLIFVGKGFDKTDVLR